MNYVNKISNIDHITDYPENYSSSDLRRAVHDAYIVYQSGNKSSEWYEQVKRICNEILEMRGERPEWTIFNCKLFYIWNNMKFSGL